MLLISIVAGLIGSLVGIGGGILIVPVLTLLFGVPIEYAIGASIVSVIATSSGSASAYVKDKITNLRVGMFLEIATSTGAIVGAVSTIFLIKSALSWIVYVVFGAVLLFSSYNLYRKSKMERRLSKADVNVTPNKLGDRLNLKGQYYDNVLKENISYEATRVPAGLTVMFCAGVISGLLGIGSGALKVLGMDTLMKLPFKVSTTTSNFMIGVTAAASTGIFYIGGFVNPIIALPVAIGVVFGSFIGTKVLVRSKPSSLRLVFIFVLVALGIEMLQRGIVLL
ncbi:MAG: sulfite exporter TauE/SafE family protein [Nitrososphaerales archaeon]